MLSVATLNVATESIFCTHYITDKFIFCKVGEGGGGVGGGGLTFGATEKETLPEIYILVFHGLASREV